MPDGLTATPCGKLRRAAVGEPPLPHAVGVEQRTPVPTTVPILPEVEILRISWSPVSAMYRFPWRSTAISVGLVNWALGAQPPSPQAGGLAHASPVPAKRVMIPFRDTTRISLSPASAI